MPTLVVTVRRGFPSEDAFLPGSSFSTMATTLSPLPYNRQIDRFTHSLQIRRNSHLFKTNDSLSHVLLLEQSLHEDFPRLVKGFSEEQKVETARQHEAAELDRI